MCFVSQMFELACEKGDNAVIDRIIENTQDLEDEYLSSGLAGACRGGQFEIAKWLHARGAEYPRACGILNAACEGGSFEIADWLVTTFNLTAEDVRCYNDEALATACEGGHLEIAKMLVDRFDISQVDSIVLAATCRGGSVATAQWLVGALGMTEKNACANSARALRWACEEGHLEMVRWLLKRFRFAGKYKVPFHAACMEGHVSIAELFVEKFDIASNARELKRLRSMLETLCTRGKLDMVKWLVRTFDMHADNKAIGWAAIEGHWDIVEWLVAENRW